MAVISKSCCFCMYWMFPQRMLIHAFCSHLYSGPSSFSKALFPSSIKTALGQMFTPLGIMEHSTNGSRLPCPIWDHIPQKLFIQWWQNQDCSLSSYFFVSAPFLLEFQINYMFCMLPFCWTYNVMKSYLLTSLSSAWFCELMVFLLLWGNKNPFRARNLFEISLELENITKGNRLVLECTIFLGEQEEEKEMFQSNRLYIR